MKFSVLLPTRNRLDLLKYAVETVRRQDYADWEIVVSDNFSDEDIGGWVRSLGDERIRYFRTERFVPVTENWNNALTKATGDYIVMLGDDDGLMKGYFSSLRREVERHGDPDFIYTSALLYAYPRVLPGHPDGFLQTYDSADFLRSSTEPFWLGREDAHALVRESLRFKVRFGYNMQFALISRRLVDAMRSKGDFYQSPYPDYYAMNAMMLVAERILVVPRPLVTIGISPKSFGFYYHNDREQGGVEFLKNLPDDAVAQRVRSTILPGTNMNTSWLLAMETLLVNYGHEFKLSVRYPSYRLLQSVQVVRRLLAAAPGASEDVRQLVSRLTPFEKVVHGTLLGPFTLVCSLLPPELRRKVSVIPLIALRTYHNSKARTISGSFANMLDVFERLDPQGIA
jgi:glycosyltransferase involved in cell wall biosynthesis